MSSGSTEIVGIGVDVVRIERFARSAQQAGFLDHVLAPPPDEPHDAPPSHSAARFAIKEAVLKCLGTGAWQDGTDFPDVVVTLGPPAQPYRSVSVRLQGAAARIAGADAHVHVSLSSVGERWLATAIMERPPA